MILPISCRWISQRRVRNEQRRLWR